MLIDTHSHLNFSAFKNDADEVIKRSLANNVWMINVGSQYETSQAAVKISQNYPKGVFNAVGLHPIHLASGIFKTKTDQEKIELKTKKEEFNYEKYKELAKSRKVVAIGEIGLDYYYRPKTKIKMEEFKNRQKEVLIKQMELAQELNLPIIFHCRMAHEDLIQQLTINKRQLRAVVHCFTGDLGQARKYLEMGFYLGFNGIIFKLDLDEIVKKTPLEKILIETDCPYLTPPPMDGRNEPIYVKYVAERIAEIKNINYKKVENITAKNARELFKI